MKNYTFDSQIKLGDKYPYEYTDLDIQHEPMFYRANKRFARNNGNILTRTAINLLPEDWRSLPDDEVSIDSRSHMLKKNWWPCIPGWHHDQIPRNRSDGQPDYDNPGNAEHIMMLLNAEVAPTEFATGKAEFSDVASGEVYYKIWHSIVEDKIKNNELKKISAPNGQFIHFDKFSWHQGTAAVKNGWRWFIRFSRNLEGRKPKNEIRRQVQVYVNEPFNGW